MWRRGLACRRRLRGIGVKIKPGRTGGNEGNCRSQHGDCKESY